MYLLIYKATIPARNRRTVERPVSDLLFGKNVVFHQGALISTLHNNDLKEKKQIAILCFYLSITSNEYNIHPASLQQKCYQKITKR